MTVILQRAAEGEITRHAFEQPQVQQRGIVGLTVPLNAAAIFRPVHCIVRAGNMELGLTAHRAGDKEVHVDAEASGVENNDVSFVNAVDHLAVPVFEDPASF